MKTFRHSLILALTCGLVPFADLIADPPEPPVGMRWVIQEQYSDEFEGKKLDSRKWNNFHPRWKGRAPAKFEKSAVSLKDGLMRIKNGVLKKPDGPYTLYGGAVTSKTDGAHFGYYECRFKASRVKMSTTFWLSGGGGDVLDTEVEGDTYRQELDIQECVGGSLDSESPGFRKQMHANTHFWYTAPGEKNRVSYPRGAVKDLSSEVWEDFHTYGAWWVDATYARFYADDEFFEAVHFYNEIMDNPLPDPMQINMVTETYNWQPYPTAKELADDSRNTSYYDWIRSYSLVPLKEKSEGKPYPHAIYKEEIQVERLPAEVGMNQSLQLEYAYKANGDRTIRIEVFRWDGKKKEVLQKDEIVALRGFGKGKKEVVLGFDPQAKEAYGLRITLRDEDGIRDSVIESVKFVGK